MGSTGSRPLPRLLPNAVIGDGDADAAIADLGDFRAFAGLDQTLTCPEEKPQTSHHWGMDITRSSSSARLLTFSVVDGIGLLAPLRAALCFA